MIHLAYTDYGTSSAAQAAVLAVLSVVFFLFAIVGYVISAFLLSKVFEKAGVQGKWRAWVPVYNYLVLAKLGDFSPWVILGLVVASVIPVLQYLSGLALFVAMIMIAYRVNAKFGREWPILLLFILGPLGQWIWLGILGFGSNPWNPNVQPSPWANSFLADKTVWNGIPVQPGQPTPAAPAGGYGAPAGYTPPAQPYTPPPAPPAAGPTPPPAPPAGTTPPPPPAGPQV
ncbi:large exoprotein [Microbacterium sp. SLBN-111]|uniref:large exoprotein n=1 Tax=Microbacterium sp. SLBN-111 TaxID=3377733 RepID=UPI003C712ED5